MHVRLCYVKQQLMIYSLLKHIYILRIFTYILTTEKVYMHWQTAQKTRLLYHVALSRVQRLEKGKVIRKSKSIEQKIIR